MENQTGLKRRSPWANTIHADCPYGRVVALYIFKNRKWLKIGEYCQGCGEIAVYSSFQKGIR